MRAKLEIAANVVTIAAALIVTTIVALRYVNERSTRLPVGESHRPGEVLGQLADVDYQFADRTVVLVLRSSCRYCTESMPFYKRLVDARKATGKRVQIIAASDEPALRIAEYLSRHSLEVDRVVSVPRGQLKVQVTPTVLVVNRAGRIQSVWQGVLNERSETQVMKVFGGPNP